MSAAGDGAEPGDGGSDDDARGAVMERASAGRPVRECTRCGACCVAPDIAALDKPLGQPCRHLGPDDLCTIYESRPAVCRAYQADALCDLVDAPTREERVRRYLAVFGLEAEATRAAGCASMAAARRTR